MPGKRHIGAGEIVGLHQRMGHKACLSAPRTIAKSEHHHGQIDIADEARNAVIDRGHGKERSGSLLGLHAAGGDEAEHR